MGSFSPKTKDPGMTPSAAVFANIGIVCRRMPPSTNISADDPLRVTSLAILESPSANRSADQSETEHFMWNEVRLVSHEFIFNRIQIKRIDFTKVCGRRLLSRRRELNYT
jgi:hypothetical protein